MFRDLSVISKNLIFNVRIKLDHNSNGVHLDCSQMVSKGLDRRNPLKSEGGVPHIHYIVVATTRQVAPIRGPGQAAHFLCVFYQGTDMVVRNPNVMVMNGTGTRSTEINQRIIERKSLYGHCIMICI